MTVSVTVTPAGLSELVGSLSPAAVHDLLDGLGAVLTGRFQASFRKQQTPGGKAWPTRLTPNFPGIVADLNAGGTPKSRRFQGRPAVVDTGRLRGSLTWRVEGGELFVGTNVSYASTQNTGGSTTHTLSAAGRKGLSAWLRADKSRRVLGLGWLFGKPTFAVKVRPRAFVEITASELRVIKDHVEQAIMGQANG